MSFEKYFPEGAFDFAQQIIKDKSVLIEITKSRITRLGDFRPFNKQWKYKITINHNLNKYSFFITYIHEVAHLYTFDKYQNSVKPHGEEWKKEFSILLFQALDLGVFPTDLAKTNHQYALNPKASSCADPDLLRHLSKFDNGSDNNKMTVLENLALHSYFNHGKSFYKKYDKRRNKFYCIDIISGKGYLMNELSKVSLLSETDLEYIQKNEHKLHLQHVYIQTLHKEDVIKYSGKTFVIKGFHGKEVSVQDVSLEKIYIIPNNVLVEKLN
jgi:hypothetical protein